MQFSVVALVVFIVAALSYTDCCKCNKDVMHYQTKMCNTNLTVLATVREKYLLNENGNALYVRLIVDESLQRNMQTLHENSILPTEIEAHYTETNCNEALVVNKTYFISGKVGWKSQTLLLDSCSLIRPISEVYLNPEEFHGIAGNYKRGCQCNIRECEYCLENNNYECLYHPSLRNVYFQYTCLPLFANKCVWTKNGKSLDDQPLRSRPHIFTEPGNYPRKMPLSPYHYHVYNHEIFDSSNNLVLSTKRRIEHKYSSSFHIDEKETDS